MASEADEIQPALVEPGPQAVVDKAASVASSQASAAEEYVIVHSGPRKASKKTIPVDDDEPLIDTTAALAKNSKKTRRTQKLQQKRQKKAAARDRPESFLDLPAELLQEILGYLQPSELHRVQLLNHATRQFILQNERAIAKDILDRRYWVLQRCFPLPVPIEEVDEASRAALQNPRREKMTEVHKKPYQHIKPLDPQVLCSCPTCLVAWNNLNVVLDLAHFQSYLNTREPIPMIPRGTSPEWNTELTEAHAKVVQRAMVRFPPQTRVHQHNKMISTKTLHPNTLYSVTERDANGFDKFLERDGALVRPSWDVPFHRDNYYGLLAYIPNRKWSREEYRWMYYAHGSHERDLEWTRRWFMPKPDHDNQSAPVATT
ncbi:hypothetical protein LTR56_010902 [Elasticomyces elasticus]|nr:hypothetical protein LTR56_010902 [Elasticomyces elasticus]